MNIPLWTRKPTKEICINQEVYHSALDCIVKVRNIRVDSKGEPLFTLETISGELYVARFCEIAEVW